MELSLFLNNLSVKEILGMYSQGLFPKINILRVVKNHITEKIVHGSVVLSHDERRLYDPLMVSFMKGDLRSSNDKSCKTSKPLCNNDDDDDLSLILEVIERDLNQNKTNAGCSRRNTATSDGFTAPNQIVKSQSNTDNDELRFLLEVIDEDLKTTSVTRNRKIINDTSLACSVKKQVGKGVWQNKEVENFTYFIKRGESENFNKKFSLTSRRMEFSFKPLGHLQQPLQWLKMIMEKLLDHITRECEADDIVGFVMESDDFPDKPNGISLRKRSQLDENVILAVLAKVFQSNSSFFTNDPLRVKVDILKLPSGKGYSAVDGNCVTFNEFSISKHSVYVITEDQFCLAAALIVAIEFIAVKFNRKTLHKEFAGYGALRHQAVELCRKAGVDFRVEITSTFNCFKIT
ncbi:hypothetical protein Zmor_027919 [Zophobas morio]|uniref:Uncharacterized protein n=1 Tax=Zophobas morio TaxID=2755281 RepID=A0AA38M3G1_9CUCU|nr:hypothetical protein Zmor_027919 [Zophobas morio]